MGVTGQKRSEEGQVVTGLAAPAAKEVHAGLDRKVSGCTEHPSIAAEQSG